MASAGGSRRRPINLSFLTQKTLRKMASVGGRSSRRKPIDLPDLRAKILGLVPEDGFVKLVTKKLEISEDRARRIFTELMKFLVTVVSSSKGPFYVPTPVDNVWHWLILDQPYYEKLAAEFEGAMPFHDPRIGGDCTEAKQEAEALGLNPDPEIWIN